MFSYWIFIICVIWMCIWSVDYGQQAKVSNHSNSGIIFWKPHISMSGYNVTRTGDWQTEKCEENFPKLKMRLIFPMFWLPPYMTWLLRYQKKIKIGGNCGMTCIMYASSSNTCFGVKLEKSRDLSCTGTREITWKETNLSNPNDLFFI